MVKKRSEITSELIAFSQETAVARWEEERIQKALGYFAP
jgi:hypothetical protein